MKRIVTLILSFFMLAQGVCQNEQSDGTEIFMFYPVAFQWDDSDALPDSLLMQLCYYYDPGIPHDLTLGSFSKEAHDVLLKTVSRSIEKKHLRRDHEDLLMNAGDLNFFNYSEEDNYLTADLHQLQRISELIGTFKTHELVISDTANELSDIVIQGGRYRVQYRMDTTVAPVGHDNQGFPIYAQADLDIFGAPKNYVLHWSEPHRINALSFFEKWTLDESGLTKEIKGYSLPSSPNHRDFCYAAESSAKGPLFKSNVCYTSLLSVPEYKPGRSHPAEMEKIKYFTEFIFELLNQAKKGSYDLYDVSKLIEEDTSRLNDLSYIDEQISQNNVAPSSWNSLSTPDESHTMFFHTSQKYDSTASPIMSDDPWDDGRYRPEDLDEKGQPKIFEAYRYQVLNWKEHLIGFRFLEDWYLNESTGSFIKEVKGMSLQFELVQPAWSPYPPETREVYIRFKD